MEHLLVTFLPFADKEVLRRKDSCRFQATATTPVQRLLKGRVLIRRGCGRRVHLEHAVVLNLHYHRTCPHGNVICVFLGPIDALWKIVRLLVVQIQQSFNLKTISRSLFRAAY